MAVQEVIWDTAGSEPADKHTVVCGHGNDF